VKKTTALSMKKKAELPAVWTVIQARGGKNIKHKIWQQKEEVYWVRQMLL